ncbi:MAG: hypothetical protein AB4042_00640 [Leptolyngbyaceae cyanobacterium]
MTSQKMMSEWGIANALHLAILGLQPMTAMNRNRTERDYSLHFQVSTLMKEWQMLSCGKGGDRPPKPTPTSSEDSI